MALDLFRLMHGIEIQSDDLSSSADILQGSGTPGGDGAQGVENLAPIGSLYMRTDANGTIGEETLQIYYKYRDTENSVNDWKLIADKNYVDAVAQGLSWREPVEVLDDTAYADAASIPTTGVIDGVTLADGDRVLFTGITSGSPAYPARNVYIWNAASPASWVEDTNEETDGDAVLVRQGTYAEQQWVYDGTNWVQFGSVAGYEELQFIRDYIGKTGSGAENPTYSSTVYVSDATSLETAIGALDAALNTIETGYDADFGDGVITNDNTDGSPAAFVLSDDMQWGTGGGTLDLTDALNEINNEIGNRTYTHSTASSVVTDGETIAESIDALDLAVTALIDGGDTISGTNVAGPVTVDSLPTPADATQVKWLIQIRETATPANVRGIEIHALTDGTNVDHTKYSVLKLGTTIAGIDVDVTVSGGNINLVVDATANFDYVLKRVGFTAF